MSDDRIKAVFYIDENPPDPPAEKAIGGWTCKCGVTKMGVIRTNAPISCTGRCVYCGDSAEIMPLPPAPLPQEEAPR